MMGLRTLNGKRLDVACPTAPLASMTAVTSAPVPIACENPAAPSKRSPKRVASKQAAGRGVSGPWSPNGDWCEAYRVQRPMPRDLRPETAVLERAINLAIWMHCPRDKQDDFRRMVNKRLRPHTGGVALFSVDKVEGAEVRLFEYVMAWCASLTSNGQTCTFQRRTVHAARCLKPHAREQPLVLNPATLYH